MNGFSKNFFARAVRRWLIRIADWHLRVAVTDARNRMSVGSATMTLVGLAIAGCILLIPSVRFVTDDFEAVETVFTALGATYGTILALVLTLSVIPIERAGEAWSASIVRLYRHDRGTYITFVWLGVCCVASFLFAVRGLSSLRGSVVLAACFVVLGISLDVLRWYHGHVCRLLDPEHAVAVGLKRGKKVVDRLKRVIGRDTRIRTGRLFANEKPSSTDRLRESSQYLYLPNYPAPIAGPIDDLAEIARKAIARGERPLARAAIGSIAELTNHYLSSRQENLTIHVGTDSSTFAGVSDVDVVTQETYDRLREINRAAVNASDEATAIQVSRAFGSMAVHAANLAAPAFSPDTAPLSEAPLRHAFDCVKFAQSKGLDDVGLQAAWILWNVVLNVPGNIAPKHVWVPIIDGLHDIVVAFYSALRFTHAATVTRYQLLIVGSAGFGRNTHYMEVLEAILGRIELQVPLAIENEQAASGGSGVLALGQMYSPADTGSLGWDFRRAIAALYAAEDQASYQAAYRRVMRMQEMLSSHLHRVAENNEFGGSELVGEIDGMIRQIAVAIADLVDKPAPLGEGGDEELISGFIGFLAFYTTAFREKTSIDGRRVEHCCDSVTYMGLRFLRSSRATVLRHCIWCIESIIESVCKASTPPHYLTLGDVFALLAGVRDVAITYGQGEVLHDLERALGKPSSMTGDEWEEAQSSIRLRHEKLTERIKQRDPQPGGGKTEVLLRELLDNRMPGD